MSRDRARSSITGRQAKAAGDAFEAFLEQQHEVALQLGILACVEHNEPHAKVIGGRLMYTERGVADYTGVLDRSGRAVAVEAKSTKAERLMKSAVSSKQQDHLDRVARAGGLALLVVEFRRELPAAVQLQIALWPMQAAEEMLRQHFRRYVCPWEKVKWQVLKTAESVSEIDLFADGGWIWGACYLERFHPRGTPSTQARQRNYPRE